ncbi:hypothetical protein DFQ27_007978 [Actinomortierella ambigua]|uniref:Uncharacterized protein n=1 Tax=Actinomortierella ambigua TaxID=1343610 RepID=A0A9P6QK10_9FUNG|nr:hypothetical protein DFQ27_007978 [Actinomortierella ambigua]
MRFSTFVPAAMALLAVTTSALPAVTNDIRGMSLNKRGDPLVDLVANIFVEAWTKINADVCVHLVADVCADLDVKVNAHAKALGGLVTTNAHVDQLKVDAKVRAIAEVKAIAEVELHAEAEVIIKAHVANVLAPLCPLLDIACIHKNAHAINAKVWANVKLDIEKLIARVRANIRAKVDAKLHAEIDELAVHAGVVDADVSLEVSLKARVTAALKVTVEAIVELWAKVKVDDIKLGAL